MDPTERALKQITTIQIEEAISKTVSELVGMEYTAAVLNIDFSPIDLPPKYVPVEMLEVPS